jgi:adenosine deaminase
MTDMDFLRALPKAELHVHLDGSLRPETMIELAADAGVDLPHSQPGPLATFMRADNSADLEDYLRRYDLTLAVLQTTEAVERVAYEMVLDHAREGVRHLEIRYCPALNTAGGASSRDILEAGLRGMRAGQTETGMSAGIIVCGLRSLDPAISVELAELAVAFRNEGVVAFDLAGGEAGNPASRHAEAFRIAARGGVARTIHAGEAWGPDSIREALVDGLAMRIGHGTRLLEDPELEEEIRDRQIPLEVCLTSNVQTATVPSVAQHPIRRYFEMGIPVTLCTDSTLVSGTTLTEEYRLARTELGFSDAELARLAWNGLEHAFMPWPEKVALLETARLEVRELLGTELG